MILIIQKIIAGTEAGGNDNGYSGWDSVYLQYDFGKERDVKKIDLYRNTYPAAVSTFKNVKVELASTADFSDSVVVYEENDYEEMASNKGAPQSIVLESPVKAQYIRIWGKGHYSYKIRTVPGKDIAMVFCLMKSRSLLLFQNLNFRHHRRRKKRKTLQLENSVCSRADTKQISKLLQMDR